MSILNQTEPARKTYHKEPSWANPTRHEFPTHRESHCHNNFPKYLEYLAREIGDRPGMFSSWVAHHLTELAQEARQLDANNPIDFDDRRAAMEHEYSIRD